MTIPKITLIGVGLLGGIFGVGGPPGMLFVSYYENRLDLKVWRAVSAFRRVGMNLARLVVFVSKGTMDVEHQWPLALKQAHRQIAAPM